MHEILKSVPGQGSVTLYIYTIHTDKKTQNLSHFWAPYKAKFEGTHGVFLSFKVSRFQNLLKLKKKN